MYLKCQKNKAAFRLVVPCCTCCVEVLEVLYYFEYHAEGEVSCAHIGTRSHPPKLWQERLYGSNDGVRRTFCSVVLAQASRIPPELWPFLVSAMWIV